MGRNATDTGCSGVGFLAAATLGLLLGAAPAAAVERPAGSGFHFSAAAGDDRILLRWAPIDRPSPYPAFLLMKREAADPVFAGVGPVPIQPMTSLAAIEAIFPAGSEIRSEVEDLIVPDLGGSLATALLSLRGRAEPARRMQREMLINANYGVAIAEGLAHLDTDVVAGTRYAYELWGVEDPAAPEPAERLGRLWVTADPASTILPAPEALVAVLVEGELGDGKVFLRWDPSAGAGDRANEPTGFGFDIYRLTGTDDPAEVIPDPVLPIDDPGSGAVKVNRVPILALPGADPRPTPGTSDPTQPDFFFVDGGPLAIVDPGAPPLLVRGRSYKYWAVPRDHLRRHGRFSAPVQVCVPDRGRPRQVTGLTATPSAAPLPSVELRWRANASDPPAAGGGVPYVDDTAAYNVYRFTRFSDLLEGPDPAFRIAENLPNPTYSDSGPGGPADPANRGVIFWYAVTAVDAGACGHRPNESASSAPARAVFYDTTAPAIAAADPYCDFDPALTSTPNPRCIRDCGPAGTGGPPPDPNTDPDLIWCQCGGASGIFPRREGGRVVDDWGYRVAEDPAQPDMSSVRLYRGFKGRDFRPVEESALVTGIVGGVPWQGFKTRETLSSRVSQKIEYRMRALDRDANLGPSAEPRGSHGQAIPAFVPGGPPVSPTILGVDHDPLAGSITVRWNATGEGALVGYLLRYGPERDARTGTFVRLPSGSFTTETTFDPALLPPGRRADLCDPDGDGRFDFDGDGVDPRDVVITDATRLLADEIAADPTLGGARDPLTGQYRHTFAPVIAGHAVEVVAVDIAGQISLPARRSDLGTDPDAGVIPWPDRPPFPEGLPLSALRPAGAPAIDLCWYQDPAAGVDARYVAVFRAVVEPGGGARGYQQRSPLLDIRAYQDPGGSLGTLDCSACAIPLPPGNPADRLCWQDRTFSASEEYLYTVVGFRGPPAPGQIGGRDEREIQAVFGPVLCTPSACPCPPEGCP